MLGKNIFTRLAPTTGATDLVDYYNKIYKDKIRGVDPKFVEKQLSSLEGCPEYQNRYARFEMPSIMNSYSPDKTMNSKITFVLWKMNSGCECLRKAGYCTKHSTCAACPVHQAAHQQLSDIEWGLDTPTGKMQANKDVIAHFSGQVVVQNHQGKIQVLITEDSGKKPVEPLKKWNPRKEWVTNPQEEEK